MIYSICLIFLIKLKIQNEGPLWASKAHGLNNFKKCYIGVWLTVVASQVALVVKNLPARAGDIRDLGSILRLGRSSGRGNGNPL